MVQIVNADDLISKLTLLKAQIEWDYPISYQLDIDKVIEIIQEVQNEQKS